MPFMQSIKETIISLFVEALRDLCLNAEATSIILEHPADSSHGDYSSNIAMALAKAEKREPLSLAVELVEKMSAKKPADIDKIEVAGPGFINFYLSKAFFENSLSEVLKQGDSYGKNENMKGKLVLVEYTDPNPFKQFHIGHLMSNVIGESISRIIEWNGADVKRICYQGDTGKHIALALWGMKFVDEPMPNDEVSLSKKADYLGRAYAAGSTKLKNLKEKGDTDEAQSAEREVNTINKKIYDQSDETVNEIYNKGKEWSLQYFEEMYKVLGTTFDRYFFESEVAPHGKSIVQHHIHDGIFEKSDGAIIFKGEDHGLHTRVFINSEGLPTYEAKELALADEKYKVYTYDLSIVVTANEVNDYFKVLLKALELIRPELAAKTKHLSHGVMKLSTGKMSSRTGDVITAESLIGDLEEKVKEKTKDRGFAAAEEDKMAEEVAVAALKYSILRQAIGRDSIFSPEQSLSFEGDSGPYLQYAHTRAQSILQKAKDAGIAVKTENIQIESVEPIHRLLYQFPEVIENAMKDYAPQHIATYLIELASSFNGYYATHKIVDAADPVSPSKIALTHALEIVMRNGLTVLGIKVPERM
jgi:arginyl-tRNA synthetase